MFAKKPCLIKELSKPGNLAAYFHLAARNLCVLLGACFAVSASAEDINMKAGLWEVTGGKEKFQACVTPEEAKEWSVPVQPQGKCVTKTSRLTDNTGSLSFTCTAPPSSGEGKVTFQSDTAYTLTLRIKGQQSEAQMSGRWLSATCAMSGVVVSLKPGLWESTPQSLSLKPGGPPDPDYAASIQYLNTMMAGKVDQFCITPELAKKISIGFLMPIPQREECTTTSSPLVDNKVKMTFTCPGFSGESEVALQSGMGEMNYSAYTITATSRTDCGEPDLITQGTARWRGFSCGSAKELRPCAAGATACIMMDSQKFSNPPPCGGKSTKKRRR